MTTIQQAMSAAAPGASLRCEQSPHRLVTMLLDGAIGRLGRAGRELGSGDSESLAAAVAIIEALQGSLDMGRGGQLSHNLFDLYDYMLRRLAEARAAGDAALLAEVAGLLDTIREGWEAIAPDVQAAAM